MKDHLKNENMTLPRQSDIIALTIKWYFASPLPSNVAKQLRNMKDRFIPALPKGSRGKP